LVVICSKFRAMKMFRAFWISANITYYISGLGDFIVYKIWILKTWLLSTNLSCTQNWINNFLLFYFINILCRSSTNMSEQLKFIVDNLNQKPFNKTYNLIR
jgi:hypothetical protein